MNQAKRVISLVLVVVMLFANCPITTFATATEAATEIHEYENFQYSILSDGSISIYGYDNAPESDTEGTYLEIPESINGITVTQIADSAFADNNYIDTVVIPESIVLIGQSAFVDCVELKAIAFYGELPEFNSDTFEGCSSLKHLYVLSGTDVEVLGSELADAGLNDVSVLEYEDLNALETAYQEYINILDAELHVDEQPTETTTAATDDVTELSETVEETTEGSDDTVSVTTEPSVPDKKSEDDATSATEESTEPSDATDSTEDSEEDADSTDATESATEATVSVNQTVSNFATNNAVAEASVVSDFTYTVLNGTYCEVTGYTGTDVVVEIPSEIDGYIVQSIAGSMFKDNTTLTTVVFPESIETMGGNVFQGCTSLTDVRLNEGLTNIGDYTFNGCTALENITLPSSVTTIGAYAFQGCTGLTDISMAEGLTKIYRNAFTGCTALVSVTLPDSVEYIGYEAFSNCTKLSSINYPASWKTAGSYNTSWAVTKEATILECGMRTRTCSVCSKAETEEIEKITVDVENNTQ